MAISSVFLIFGLLAGPKFAYGNEDDVISLVNNPLPEFGNLPETAQVSIAFVLPYRNLTQIHGQIQRYFQAVTRSSYMQSRIQLRTSRLQSHLGHGYMARSRVQILPHFQANLVYTSNLSISETVKRVFCSPDSRGLNTLVTLIDPKVGSDDECRLASFLTMLASDSGIPSLLWSSSCTYQTDDTPSGEGASSEKKRLMLLAPSMLEQATAILDFLNTNRLKACALVVVMSTPGAEDFIRAMVQSAQRESNKKNAQRKDVHDEHNVDARLAHIVKLAGGRESLPQEWRKSVRNELLFIRESTKARVILLWSSAEHANDIFSEARILGMTAESYLWIGGKPLITDTATDMHTPTSHHHQMSNIVPGTVVASYDTSPEAQLEVIKATTQIWMRAVRRLFTLPSLRNVSELSPGDLCADGKRKPWRFRNIFLKFIKETKRESDEVSSNISKIGRTVVFSFMDNDMRWRRLGNWTTLNGFIANQSNFNTWMLVRGESNDSDHSKFLRIVTLEEPPYIIYSDPDPVTRQCPDNGVPCDLSPYRVQERHASLEHEKSDSYRAVSNHTHWEAITDNKNQTHYVACCSGLCIDLLRRLSSELNFKYHIFEVRDRKWGGIDKVTGEWNGLVRAILDGEADLVLTSLKINQQRSKAIDFTLPFLETGITIMVAVRPGAISAMALIEPFSPSAWCAILFGCVTAVVLFSTVFDHVSFREDIRRWKSLMIGNRNSGLPNNSASYNVFSALWLVWAMLFKAAIRAHLPNSLGAKLLTGVWGMFCVIFVSSYMANLAVFMITKDDFYDFSGLEDYRLTNPFTKQPPYRFGTITSGATEAFIRQNYPDLHEYMRQFNQSSASDGIVALKAGKLDAFVYDATVLEYKSSRDPHCQLNVVGKWYAMTGYGIGFPHGSTWLHQFEKYIIELQYSGYLARLSQYWLSGVCKYRKKAESSKSFQLGIRNFTSAFVLLFLGLIFCSVVLGVEYLISKYFVSYFIRKKLETREYQESISRDYTSNRATAKLSVLKESGLTAATFNRRRQSVSAPKPAKIRNNSDGSIFAGVCYAVTVKCKNCGGRGHSADECSSHPATHLLLANCEDINGTGDGSMSRGKNSPNRRESKL